jgi:hypothetical protein
LVPGTEVIIQSLRSLAKVEEAHEAFQVIPTYRCEALRRWEMTTAKPSLALAVEYEFGWIRLGANEDDIRSTWKRCSSSVERSAEGYTTATGRWRTAMEDGVALVSGYRVLPGQRRHVPPESEVWFKSVVPDVVARYGLMATVKRSDLYTQLNAFRQIPRRRVIMFVAVPLESIRDR